MPQARLSIDAASPHNGGLIHRLFPAMNDFFLRLPEFVGNHLWMVLLFVVALVFLVVTELARLRRGFKELTPALLTQMINRDDAMVFDVSPRVEFDKGHIPGAHHVDLDQFDPESEKLAAIRDKPVVMVCRSGVNSAKAAARLHKAGFHHAYTLAGGIEAWTRANLPLSKDRK